MNQFTQFIQPIAIALAGLLIGIGLYFASPRYAFVTIPTSANPAIWKLDIHSGDVSLCVTGTGKDANGKETESGCGIKFKQY